jgi:PIN domain nuclease of toxin-antitoxin system
MMYVVDTHPLIWLLDGDSRLSSAARAALSSPTDQQVIPAIVLAEMSFLYQRQRVRVNLAAVLAHVMAVPNTRIFPLDEAVVERLPGSLNIHDGIVVATALLLRDVLGEEVILVTKDKEIAGSGLIRTLW